MLTKIARGEKPYLRDWVATNPHEAYSEFGGLGNIVRYYWWLDTYWVEFQRHDGRFTVPVASVSVLSPAY